MDINNSFYTQQACLEDLSPLLDQQIEMTKSRYKKIFVFAGVSAGVAALVSTVVSGIFLARSIPFVEKTVMRRGVEVLTQVSVNETAFVLYILLASIGWLVTTPLAAVISLGMVYLFRIYEISNIAQTKLSLEEKYEKTGAIEPQDIANVLKLLDTSVLQSFVEKMDFQQLGEVKKALGDVNFNTLIEKIKKESHQQWKTIQALKEKPQEIENKKATILKLADNNPFFLHTLNQEIQKQTGNPNHPIFEYSFHQCTSIASPSPVVIVRINHSKEINVNLGCLTKNSGYFKVLLGNNFKKTEDGSIEVNDIEDVEAFESLLQILQGNYPKLTLELALRILAQSDYINCERVTNVIDQLVLNHLEQFSEKDILSLAQRFIGLSQTRKYLERQALSKKITSSNWQDLWEKSQLLHSSELENKCRDFAFEKIINSLNEPKTSIMSLHYLASLDEERAKILCKKLEENLNTENLLQIFAFAERTKMVELKNSCSQFCIQNQATCLSAWNLANVPQEVQEVILEILYPTPRVSSEAW